MALRKQDVVVELPRRRKRVRPVASSTTVNEASLVPRPLLELYNRASLFMDKQSAVYDHYWAVGIHKAIHKAFPEFAELKQAEWSTIRKRASKGKRGRRSSPRQLRLELVRIDRADLQGSDGETQQTPPHRFRRAITMDVGQRVLLVCAIWSNRNGMSIESGTWGEITEVGSTLKVDWELPYFRSPLWDRFPPDEYTDYFEEE